jgi:hypothetical protein
MTTLRLCVLDYSMLAGATNGYDANHSLKPHSADARREDGSVRNMASVASNRRRTVASLS